MEINKIQIEFSQEGNSLGTTDEYETLNLNFEYQLPGEGPFIVIKTDGWSINESSELKEFINKVEGFEKKIRESVNKIG